MGVLALMGSGETSPTMVRIHRDLAAGSDTGLLLPTPYAFQENEADISARAQKYFARSIGISVCVAPDDDERAGLGIRTAAWVFSGPGSPTYALERWRGGAIERALRARLWERRGTTVLASAAAATVGVVAVPVYEIYKVGAPPHWLDGLDLLRELGLRAAVIPHYDNAEGGTHDTRYCYLGERRLRVLEGLLPSDAGVLGIDEHTAVTVDLTSGDVTVTGRGGLTVRHAGASTVLPSGSRTSVAALTRLLRGERTVVATSGERGPDDGSGPECPVSGPSTIATLTEVTSDCTRRFEEALARRDAAGMVSAVLDLEAAITAWAADTEEDEGTTQARDVLRGLVVRLGEVAADGLRDPVEQLGPYVEPLLAVRATLRERRAYDLADTIRQVLVRAGVEVRDEPSGTTWGARKGE